MISGAKAAAAAGYYKTNSAIGISIYYTCNAAPTAVDYKIKFHL